MYMVYVCVCVEVEYLNASGAKTSNTNTAYAFGYASKLAFTNFCHRFLYFGFWLLFFFFAARTKHQMFVVSYEVDAQHWASLIHPKTGRRVALEKVRLQACTHGCTKSKALHSTQL